MAPGEPSRAMEIEAGFALISPARSRNSPIGVRIKVNHACQDAEDHSGVNSSLSAAWIIQASNTSDTIEYAAK